MENKNNSSVDIRFLATTSDIKNFSQNARSDVNTSEVATLLTTVQCSYLTRLCLKAVVYCSLKLHSGQFNKSGLLTLELLFFYSVRPIS